MSVPPAFLLLALLGTSGHHRPAPPIAPSAPQAFAIAHGAEGFVIAPQAILSATPMAAPVRLGTSVRLDTRLFSPGMHLPAQEATDARP